MRLPYSSFGFDRLLLKDSLDQGFSPSFADIKSRKRSMVLRFWVLLLIHVSLALVVDIPAHAQSPRTFTVDARLFNPVTPTDPLADNNLVVNIKILNPGKTCVLYEETQTVSTAADGRFNLQVGSATGSVKRTGTDPNNAMSTVFQNISAIATSNSACTSGYTPAAADLRYMRITLTPSSTGVPETLTPDTVLDSVPTAIVAESLQGLDRTRVLEIGTPSTLSQTNVATVFSATNYPKLTSLLAGSSQDYVRSSTTNGASLPSLASSPSSPTAGQIWYDSTVNTVKYYDGSTTRAIGYSGSSITSPLTNGKFWVGNSSNAATEVSVSGDASMTNTGAITVTRLRGASVSATAPTTSGQVLRYTTSTSSWSPSFLTMADIYSNVTVGQTILPSSSCAADKTLSWSSLTDVFTCQSIAIADSQITYAARAPRLVFAGPATGTATAAPTFRALTLSDLPAGAASQWTASGSDLYFATGNVAIGTSSPFAGAALTVHGLGTTSALVLPRDSTTARPSGVNGMVRYNSTIQKFEAYEGGNWHSYADTTTTASSGAIGALQLSAGAGLGFNSDAPNLFWDSSNKYLGIGTASPNAPINVVAGANNATLRLQNTNSSYPASVVFRDSTGADRATTQWSNAMSALVLATYNSDPVILGTAGAERLRVTGDGRVGIGTNSPVAGAVLDLSGTSTNTSSLVLPRASTTTRPSTGVNGMLRYNVDENSFEGFANGHWSYIGAAGAAGTIDDLLDASTYGGTNSVFLGRYSGNNNTADGNTATGVNSMTAIVGGSSNTAFGNLALTSVVSGSRNTALGYVAGRNITGSDNTLVGANAGQTITSGNSNILIGSNVQATSATANNQLNIGDVLFGDLTNKRIAIGTSTPTSMLHLYNSSTLSARTTLEGSGGTTSPIGHQLRPSSAMASGASVMYGAVDDGASSARAGIYVPNSAGNGVLEAISVLKSTGNVGIGTTATTYKLEVDGSVKMNGNVGIGTSAVGAFKMEVDGNVKVYGNLTANNTISDRRFKKGIRPLEGSLEKILKLRGVRYHMRTSEFPNQNFDDQEKIGLIAQEVETVFPQVVQYDGDGYRSINYGWLVSPLAEATKELYGLCRAHDEKIVTLEKSIEKLSAENAVMKSYLCAKDPAAPFCH
jgi:hypothetical protein